MYLVNGIEYPSKLALQDVIRAILDKTPAGGRLDRADEDVMFDVLAMHPKAAEKIGCGVKSMGVQYNQTYRRNKEFVIFRVDGSQTEFSYQKCLCPPTQRARFIQACRQALIPGMMAFSRHYFKTTVNPRCPHSGLALTPQNAHVDHVYPLTFRRLLEDFMIYRRVDIDRVALSAGGDNNCIVRIVDKQLEQAWIDYHWKRARLQVISAQANLALSDNEPPPPDYFTPEMAERRQIIENQMIAKGWRRIS